jgi:hypothetical protein
MKAHLEFTLPEESTEFTFANHGNDFWRALQDIMDTARAIRNGDRHISSEQFAMEIIDRINDTPGMMEIE